MKGYVYCLTNEMYKGVCKIGFTERGSCVRALELYSSGVPCEFKVEYSKYVRCVREVERRLHEHFSQYRVNASREFFRVSKEQVYEAIKEYEGQWEVYDGHYVGKTTKPKVGKTTKPKVVKTNRKLIHKDIRCESWALKRRRLRRECSHK